MLKMHENSLFAVLLRSPWWVSLLVAAGIAGVMRIFLAIEYALFGDQTEMAGAIERLRSAAARKAYLDNAQSEIWDRYSPNAVARRFLEVVRSAQRRPGGVRSASFLPWLRRASGGNAAWPAVYEAIHLARRLRGKVPS